MASWLVKAAVHGAASRPAQVTRAHPLDDARFMENWRYAKRHLRAHYLHGGRAPALDTVVALGVGAWPIVPIGLSLSGARRVIAFDVAPIVARDRVVATLQTYRRFAHSGRLPALDPDACERIDEALARASERSAVRLLEALGVLVRRVDARYTGLPAHSIDLLAYDDAFEHVPSPELAAIFRELHRIAHPGSVMSLVGRATAHRALLRDAQWSILEDEQGEASMISVPAPLRMH